MFTNVALKLSLLLLLLPGLVLRANAQETRSVQVEDGSFNAYGHWLCDDGIIEFTADGDKLFADGWQVYELLTRTPAVPILKQDSSPEAQLVQEVCELRDRLFDQGKGSEEVVAACREVLEHSDLIDGQVTHASGPVYSVPWKDGPALMDLGRRGPRQEPALTDMEAHQRILVLMDKMVRFLEDGNMIVLSSLPLPNVSFIPAIQREEVERLLREAAERSTPISEDNWEKHSVIKAGVAEQMRKPLPESRKKG